MALTLRTPDRTIPIVAPSHELARHVDPTWRAVEAVACRFALPSHRRAVRIHLYAVLGDMEALRRFGATFRRCALRRAAGRGAGHLEAALRSHPAVFGPLMAELGVVAGKGWTSSGNSRP